MYANEIYIYITLIKINIQPGSGVVVYTAQVYIYIYMYMYTPRVGQQNKTRDNNCLCARRDGGPGREAFAEIRPSEQKATDDGRRYKGIRGLIICIYILSNICEVYV